MLPGVEASGSAYTDLDIPHFLRRDEREKLMTKPTMEEMESALAAAETEEAEAPSTDETEAPGDKPAAPVGIEEVLNTLRRLSDKQADIEQTKNRLKQELINEIWML